MDASIIAASRKGRLDHAGTGAWVALTSASFFDATADVPAALTAGLRMVGYTIRNVGLADAHVKFTATVADATTTNRLRIGPGETATDEINGLITSAAGVMAVRTAVGTTLEIEVDFVGAGA